MAEPPKLTPEQEIKLKQFLAERDTHRKMLREALDANTPFETEDSGDLTL